MRLAFFIFSLFLTLSLYGQNCNRTKPINNQDFELFQENYIPNDTTPILTIKMAFHVWRDDNGNGNYWLDTPQYRDTLQQVVNLVNWIYLTNEQFSDPIEGAIFIPDTKVRFEIDTVYYYNCSNVIYDSSNNYSILFYFNNPNIFLERKKIFACHLTPQIKSNGAAGSSIYGSGLEQIIEFNQQPDSVNLWCLAQNIAHEFGHNFNLRHTYYVEPIEFNNITDPDFLWDIFGNQTQSWCMNSQGVVCMHDAGWTIDPFLPDSINTATNNIMGGTNSKFHFSALQIGRIHRSLSTANIRNFAYGYSDIPYIVSGTKTIDFTRKFYQNVIIENGGCLTLKCTTELVPEASIIVKPGGKLIIDGGKITKSFNCNYWQGIIVEGNENQTQMGVTPNQGIVILNGATIENAICGVKVGDPLDPSKNGGIVYAYNTDFKNCKNAVSFAPYKNMNNNLEFANRSKFTDCDFIIDNDFDNTGLTFNSHVQLLGVNGITFTGCRFTNSRTTFNPPAYRYASSGISAFNSGFKVQPKCLSNLIPGEICTQNDIDIESIFTGLDYGIVAQGCDNFYKISVLSTKFISNDYGIYLSGVNNAKILNNSFTIAKNNNNLAFSPVGLFILGGSGFRIEENEFLNNSFSSLDKIGIRVKNTGKENNQIYKNLFVNLTYGQIFDGINYSTRNPSEGLVSLCNENQNNVNNDFWVRKINGFDFNGINQHQGVLLNTGSMMQIVSCAGNTFSTSPLYQYQNDGNYLYYLQDPNYPSQILSIYSSNIDVINAPENPCPSKINALNIQTIETELSNITLNYANLKYNYNELIDAGNTEELLLLIQGEWSDDVWELRTELLGKSPYLSQEVLNSIAFKNSLPPALFLEICLANPDATKSEEFLEKLSCCIPNPLPEYMINLIRASWNQKTLRTELEEELSAFKTYRDEYQNYKTEILLSDTIYNYTDIINHLESRGSYSDYLSMAEIAINQDDFMQANLYLDILEYYPEKLSSEEIAEISSFRDYFAIRESIFLDSTTIYNLDSTQIATLEAYASSNNYRGAILARNILCFLYNICIEDVPAPPKILRVGSNTNSNKNSTPYIASVKVMPNPANSYASFIWDMKSYTKPANLFIYDQNGKEVLSKQIETQQGQWIWDLRNISSGVYVFTLKSDQLVLFSGKVIVNK
jgi:hypothetical protein